MSKGSLGAVGVVKDEKQQFSCIIKKICCQYKVGKGKYVVAELYKLNTAGRRKIVPKRGEQKSLVQDGLLKGRISNNCYQLNYFFLSNSNGKELELKCERETNNCTLERHSQYVRDYINIENRQLESETKTIEDGKIELYYYNFLYRAGKFTKQAAKAIWSKTKEEPILDRAVLSAAGAVGGLVAGSGVDFVYALRFIHLPEIEDSDFDYECHTTLYYDQCQLPDIPPICIHIYPDIKYSLEIGFFGVDRTYFADASKKDKIKTTPFTFNFNAEYGSRSFSLDFGKENEFELDSRTQEGSILYKTINSLAEFLNGTACFAETLGKILKSEYGDNDAVVKDVGHVQNSFELLGHGFSNSGKWLSSSLSISPQLKGEWQYAVSEDLTSLQRHIVIDFGLEAEGKLKIDLISLCRTLLNKGKDVTIVATAAATVSSGGLAALPAILIKFIVDKVLESIIKKFTESIHFDLVFIGKAGLQSFSYDSLREETLKGAGIKLDIEFRIDAGLDCKTSIGWSVIIEMKGTMMAMAHLSASMSFQFDLTEKFDSKKEKRYLGIDVNGDIKPFTVKLEYLVEGSFTILGGLYSDKSTPIKPDEPMEWTFGGTELSPGRFNLFKLDRDDTD